MKFSITTFLPLLALPSASFCQLTTAIKNTLLEQHNYYRNVHGAPALAWNDTIAAAAQAHVSSCNFALASGTGYGQNLGAGVFQPNAGGVTKYWYDNGASQYNYSDPGFSSATGTFTQVIWVRSTQLGCGVQRCEGRGDVPGWLIACFYSPPGNVIGYFGTSVLPPNPGAIPTTTTRRMGKRESVKLSLATYTTA